MSCKLFMCLFYLSTASLRNIHWKYCPYSVLFFLVCDSAASIAFERGQQTHSTVCVENLKDTLHLSESHRKLVKNVDFSKQMFPGINKKEQDRVRAIFSMNVTKRCSAEIKQAHKQFAGHMTKIIRKLGYTSDSIVACLSGQCGQLCKKLIFLCVCVQACLHQCLGTQT
jgi:hypothetical protein